MTSPNGSTTNLPADPAAIRRSFDHTWATLSPIGRSGGYNRFPFTAVDLSLREWFTAEATKRGLDVEVDRNGNQWAWWGTPTAGAVATGSHLDSVPGGGAFDGPLGVVSSFLALDALRAAGITPVRPLVIINFFEEEGSRFGLACLGSRLMTGQTDPDRARALTDNDGISLADAADAAGIRAQDMGHDADALAKIGVFVELHVEQGKNLVNQNASVGVASAIWPHGRWRFTFTGEGNHAGTTALIDRRDPMLPFATTILAARSIAETHDAVSTFGRVRVDPNGTNAIPARVDAWLDTRAADEASVTGVVRDLSAEASAAGTAHGVEVEVSQESWTPVIDFHRPLRDRLVATLDTAGISAPVLPTGAGHDAGILSNAVPTAMLFVRNPTGVSHSPREHAEEVDCVDGVIALAAVLTDLLTSPAETVAAGQ